MSSVLLILANYVDILFLLSSLCLMVLIYIKSRKKEEKMKWMSRALVLVLLLLTSVFNLFLEFTSNIQSSYNHELIMSVSMFISLITSIFFLVLILGKKYFLKLL